MRSENRNQNRISLHVLKPASSAVGSDGSFLFDAYTRRNVLFAHSTSSLPRVLGSQGTGHDKTWRVYAPLSWESSLLSLRAVGGLWLEVSPEAWEPDPFLVLFFSVENDLLFRIEKSSYITGSAPHVPSETSRHRPPTALKLGSEGSTLSGAYTLQVWSWSVPCEARTRGGDQALCAKIRFFLLPGQVLEQK